MNFWPVNPNLNLNINIVSATDDQSTIPVSDCQIVNIKSGVTAYTTQSQPNSTPDHTARWEYLVE